MRTACVRCYRTHVDIPGVHAIRLRPGDSREDRLCVVCTAIEQVEAMSAPERDEMIRARHSLAVALQSPLTRHATITTRDCLELTTRWPLGVLLADELVARGWTLDQLVSELWWPLQVSASTVIGVMAGDCRITLETAQALGVALGTPAGLWLALDPHNSEPRVEEP